MKKLLNLFSDRGLKLSNIPLDAVDYAAEKEDIYLWEIHLKQDGHLRRCAGDMGKRKWEGFVDLWRRGKAVCKCAQREPYVLAQDAADEVVEFIEELQIAKFCSSVKVKVDVVGRIHVLIRCSRYFALLIQKCKVVSKLTMADHRSLE